MASELIDIWVLDVADGEEEILFEDTEALFCWIAPDLQQAPDGRRVEFAVTRVRMSLAEYAALEEK